MPAQDALKKLRKEVQEKDTEIDRKTKIAKRFCAAYEKVNLLEVSEDNVRIWVDCTRMKPDEMLTLPRNPIATARCSGRSGTSSKHGTAGGLEECG